MPSPPGEVRTPREIKKLFTIVLQGLSWLAFLAGTIALGAWLRSNPSKGNAERASRILHFLFWMGVFPSGVLGIFHPGLRHFDAVLGLYPLPAQTVVRLMGTFGFLVGSYLMLISNIALWFSGRGANAFFLTQKLVTGNIYMRMRNPMSLGLYLYSVGTCMLIGSTYLTLGTLLVAIPVHVFYLKYFEEYELVLRMGQPYMDYKQQVPFMFPKLFSHQTRDYNEHV